MKEEIKQTLINGIESGEFTSSFSDDLHDNLDQLSEYLANQEILMNREVILINKHYSGETKILKDTYYASKKTDLARSIKKIMQTKNKYKERVKSLEGELYSIPMWIRRIFKAN